MSTPTSTVTTALTTTTSISETIASTSPKDKSKASTTIPEDSLTEARKLTLEAALKIAKEARKLKFKAALKEAIAKKQASRAFKQFKDIQGPGFDIIQLDKENRRKLDNRLRNVMDPALPLTDEMRSWLKKELAEETARCKGVPQLLTRDEKRVFKMLLQGSWGLKHATSFIEQIEKGGNTLLSLEERIRRGHKVENDHTGSAEGNSDNVFFTFGPGDISTIRFLDQSPTVINVDHEKIVEEGYSALTGLWSSWHLFAFDEEQEGESLKIFGTECNVRYVKQKKLQNNTATITSNFVSSKDSKDKKEASENESSQNEDDDYKPVYIKEYRYKHILPMGDQKDSKEKVEIILTETVHKSDDIYLHPYICAALTKRTIEKFRYLGKPAWMQLMKADLKTHQQVMQNFFHPGSYEVHEPGSFSLDEPGVRIERRTYYAADKETGQLLPLIKAALKGQTSVVIGAFEKDPSLKKVLINKPITIHQDSMNILAASILGGEPTLVDYLLKASVDINAESYYSTECRRWFPVTALVLALSNPDTMRSIMQKLWQDKRLHEEKDKKPNLKIKTENAEIILDHLINQGAYYQDNPNISILQHMDIDAFSDACILFKPSMNMVEQIIQKANYPLEKLTLQLPVYLRSESLARKMFTLDMKLTFPYDPEGLPLIGSEILPGMTPVLFAAYTDQTNLVDLYLEQGAHVDDYLSFSGSKHSTIRVAREEGFTPLFFAVQNGNLAMIRVLLEKHNANIHHRAANGQNVIEMFEHPFSWATLSPALSSPEKIKKFRTLIANYTEILSYLKVWAQKSEPRLTSIKPYRFSALNPAQESTLIKEALPYKILQHQACVLTSYTNEKGERCYSFGWDNTHHLSFNINSGYIRQLSKTILVDSMTKQFQLESSVGLLKHFEFIPMGLLTAGVSNKIHYANHILFITHDQWVSKELKIAEQLKGVGGAYSFSLTENELAHLIKHTKEEQELVYQGCTFPRPTTEFLKCIIKKGKDKTSLTGVELESLQTVYRDYLQTRQDCLKYARKGQILRLRKALKKYPSIISQDIPVLTKPKTQFLIPPSPYVEGTTLLEETLEAGHYHIALELVVAGAKIPKRKPVKFPSEKVFKGIIKNGHIQLYLALRKQIQSLLNDEYASSYVCLDMLQCVQENQLDIYKLLEPKLAEQRTIPTYLEPDNLIITAINSAAFDMIPVIAPKISESRRNLALGNLLDNYGKDKFQAEDQDIINALNQLKAEIYPSSRINSYDYFIISKCLSVLLLKGNFTLFRGIISIFGLTVQNENYESEFWFRLFYQFPMVGLVQNPEFKKLLDELLMSNGSWSPFVTLINALGHREEGLKFVKTYAEDSYPKLASEALKLKEAIRTGDIKTLSEFAISKQTANLFFLTPSDDYNYFHGQFITGFEYAIEQRQFPIASLLLKQGAEVSENRIDYSNIATLLRNGRLDILEECLRQKPQLPGFWSNLDSFIKSGTDQDNYYTIYNAQTTGPVDTQDNHTKIMEFLRTKLKEREDHKKISEEALTAKGVAATTATAASTSSTIQSTTLLPAYSNAITTGMAASIATQGTAPGIATTQRTASSAAANNSSVITSANSGIAIPDLKTSTEMTFMPAFAASATITSIVSVLDEKSQSEKYCIFLSSAPKTMAFEQEKTGDVDYAMAIQEGLNSFVNTSSSHAVKPVTYIRGLSTEQAIYNFVDKNKANASPVLHLLLNAPDLGFGCTAKGLKDFKKRRGAKLVITSVEFFKHGEHFLKYKWDILTHLKLADKIIFLDEPDRRSAITTARIHFPKDIDLVEKLEAAVVIPVPATIQNSEDIKSQQDKGSDILCFGMIRPGKGLANIRKLAELMKASTDPLIQKKKILVVGSVQEHDPRAGEELAKLMMSLYPSKKTEILALQEKYKDELIKNYREPLTKLIPVQNLKEGAVAKENSKETIETILRTQLAGLVERLQRQDSKKGQELQVYHETYVKGLKKLLTVCQNEESSGKLQSDLPIELHIDVPKSKLPALFKRCTYSYLPMYRGATLRNTSISSSIANGFVTYSHCDSITPKILSQGKYSKAMVLLPEMDDDRRYDCYAQFVLEDIIKREQNPKLNAETLACAKALVSEVLSREVIAEQHIDVYESVGVSLEKECKAGKTAFAQNK